jgi:hypothetical protein
MFFQRPKKYRKEREKKDCSSFRVGLGERRSRVIFVYVADLAVEMILAKWGGIPHKSARPLPKSFFYYKSF